MKKKWIILVIYLLLVVGAMVGLFITLPDEPKKVVIEGSKVEEVERNSKTESPEIVAGEFFSVIYEYDTSTRLFYEGAEAYMTRDAYEQLLPMPSEGNTEDVFFHMQSRLEDFSIYKREISETEVELLAPYSLNLADISAKLCVTNEILEMCMVNILSVQVRLGLRNLILSTVLNIRPS